jgi:hypothetical protein
MLPVNANVGNNAILREAQAAAQKGGWNRTSGDTEIIIKSLDQKTYARGSGTVVLQEIDKSPANRLVPII